MTTSLFSTCKLYGKRQKAALGIRYPTLMANSWGSFTWYQIAQPLLMTLTERVHKTPVEWELRKQPDKPIANNITSLVHITLYFSGRGRLLVTPNLNPQLRPLLPQGDDPECREIAPTVRCFRAGLFLTIQYNTIQYLRYPRSFCNKLFGVDRQGHIMLNLGFHLQYLQCLRNELKGRYIFWHAAKVEGVKFQYKILNTETMFSLHVSLLMQCYK